MLSTASSPSIFNSSFDRGIVDSFPPVPETAAYKHDVITSASRSPSSLTVNRTQSILTGSPSTSKAPQLPSVNVTQSDGRNSSEGEDRWVNIIVQNF